LSHYVKEIGKTINNILGPSFTPTAPSKFDRNPVKIASVGAMDSYGGTYGNNALDGTGSALGDLLILSIRFSPFAILLSMEGDSPQEGPIKEKNNNFKENLKDIQENPNDWEETSEDIQTTTGTQNKGGQSIEKEFTNKTTGEKIYQHILKKKNGSDFESPHYRPYPKQK
jgi:hypothetical protein